MDFFLFKFDLNRVSYSKRGLYQFKLLVLRREIGLGHSFGVV